ncbi:DUF6798 domain-containing protein [Rubripirellula obstinata]|nr:DUF6798 domain-containing protein [Rubripirellula obstinata]
MNKPTPWRLLAEWFLLIALMFVYAGDAPPMVNEAHYLVKAKNFWQPDWCAADLFASSGKAHVFFYWALGWPTQYFSLETTAWIGRIVGWSVLAFGLMRLSHVFSRTGYASIAIAVLWIAGIEYGNLAGEWVVGGIEGKVPAYGFVLAAIAELARRNWNRVWVLLGIASAFHVLTGGWSVIAAMFAWAVTEAGKPKRHPLLTRWLFLGGLISLAGIIPAAQLMMGTSSTDAAQAAKIYSLFRIRHHLLPSDFLTWWYIRHGIVITILICFAIRQRVANRLKEDEEAERRFLAFVGGAGLIAVGGLLIGLLVSIFPDLSARLLRYYWFRLSDAMIPLGMAIVVVGTLSDQDKRWRVAAKSLLVLAFLMVGYASVDRMLQRVPPSVNNRLMGWDMDSDAATKRAVFKDWLAVCNWAALSSPENEVFLTPRHQQTFKWYSGRSEVVNWKDVPQDAISLIEWKKRFQEVFPERLGAIRVTINYKTLRKFREQYNVRYMIVDRRVVGEHLPLLRVYPTESSDNVNYAVYETPK